MILMGGEQVVTESHYLPELHPVLQGPGRWGDCSQRQSAEGLPTEELGQQSGAWRFRPPYSLPGWAPERDLRWK